MQRRIGLLGGMGPGAGMHVHRLIIEACWERGCYEDEDFPEILILSQALPGMTPLGLEDDSATLRRLTAQSRTLINHGCTVRLSACNSTSMLMEMIDPEALSLPRLGLMKCLSENFDTITILCSQSASQQVFNPISEQMVLKTSPHHHQLACNEAISLSMKGQLKEARALMHEVLSQITTPVLIGCTELSMCLQEEIKEGHWAGLPLLDTALIGAREAVEQAIKASKERPGALDNRKET